MRPTGALHLGNYHGALKNWTELQYQYECYFFIADIHALTTGYEDTRQLEVGQQGIIGTRHRARSGHGDNSRSTKRPDPGMGSGLVRCAAWTG